MKCPCCDRHTDADVLVHNNFIYFADGTTHPIKGHEATVFNRLMKHPVAMGDTHRLNGLAVAVSRLRAMFKDLGLPFEIHTNREHRQYVLKRIKPDEQNNNPTERSQDVHSGPRIHDI